MEEIQDIIRAAREQGWVVTQTSSGHYRFVAPSASIPPIVTSLTPSDHRAWKNLRAMLKRAGLRFGRTRRVRR